MNVTSDGEQLPPETGPPDKNPQENKMEVESNKFNLENRYSSTDIGPYYVIVEPNNSDIRISAVKVGHFLFNDKTFNKDVSDIKLIGRNKVKIVFKRFQTANEIIGNQLMKANNLIAYIPTFYNHKKGVIKLVDTFLDENYIKENMVSDKKVVEVKRMKRKVVSTDGETHYVPRQTLVVTFLGNSLPQYVKINLVRFLVEPYIYPVVQCFKCLRYGHTAKYCRSTAVKCKKCGQLHDEKEMNECKDGEFCIYCEQTGHQTTSKKCPKYIEQFNIKKIMSFQNLSFKEAEILINNPSYSKIADNNRFSVLNNLDNFPNLNNVEPSTSESKNWVTRPPSQPPKKRKAISPLKVRNPPHFPNKTSTDKTILPNPYREEFQLYKEKLETEILLKLPSVFEHIIKRFNLVFPNVQILHETRNELKTILDTVSNISESDDDCY